LFAAAALYLSLLALVLMAWTLAFRQSRRCAWEASAERGRLTLRHQLDPI